MKKKSRIERLRPHRCVSLQLQRNDLSYFFDKIGWNAALGSGQAFSAFGAETDLDTALRERI